jgi:thiamine kinase-like enzyme
VALGRCRHKIAVSPEDSPKPLDLGRRILRTNSPRTDRDLVHQIAELHLGTGPITVVGVEGGISNRNFAVRIGDAAYFARQCEERPLLGIDRRNEAVCHRIASGLGVAPEVIHSEKGLLVTRFVLGRTLTSGDVKQDEYIPRVAALLKQLHDSWSRLSGEILYFCPFQTVRTYARTAAAIGAQLPVDLSQLLAGAALLSRQIGPFRPTLCHNDMLAANLIDADGRLWLVDWEYAGIGHPWFDLANLSANARFSAEQDRDLLTAYHGDASAAGLTELRIFKAISLLRESLWATIQTVASDIDFDYHAYAAENLDAFRHAAGQLT